MLDRRGMKEYAKRICIPLMERTLRRARNGNFAYKADQVGFVPAFLENFCRPFWGIAPLLAQGEELVLHVDDQELSVFEYMHEILTGGFSSGEACSWERYREYFSPYAYENQNITELAGLCIGIYFARKQLWEPFSQEEKDWIARQIYEMAVTAFDHSWPNNHYWFPLFAVTVLKRLGYCFERTEDMLSEGLSFLDRLYIGNGWYKDGEFGRFDYYEAWSLHLYPLLWTLIADDTFEGYEMRRKSYIERTNQFLEFYPFWFDEKGANVPFGRSLSYRFAACALCPAAVLAGCSIEPELAGRLTCMNIDFFRTHYRGEETDILEEGYLYHSSSVVEGYTSDGGAYWCCKAFLALFIPEEHSFWNTENVKIPAEHSSYLAVPGNENIHMLFEGNDGMVTMYNNTAQYYHQGMMTHKFGDVRSWYSKFAYHSAGGFGCSCSDNLAFDNMISLMTPDHSMSSHRLGFTDLGYADGALHSVHVPFANDPQTTVESWVIPLGGAHVRVHRVELSQPYYVREGGFSLGRWDDYCPKEIQENELWISGHEYVSAIKATATVPLKLMAADVQAGYHLYAPLASYPAYGTELLNPGIYWFASGFMFAKKGSEEKRLPDAAAYLMRFKNDLK